MKASALLSALAIANLLLGFLIQSWVLVVVGAGVESDAFVASLIIPQFLYLAASSQLPAVLVPLLMEEALPGQLRKHAWSVLAAATAGFGGLAVLLMVTAEGWVPLLVPGLDPMTKELTIHLSRIQTMWIVFITLHRIIDAVCHARGRFVRVELADLVSNAAALTVLVHALPRFGIEVAAWVTVMRPAAAMLLLLPSAGRPVRPWFGSPVLRIGAQRLRPIVLGSLYSKSGSVLDRWLASWTGIGTLSLLHFAERLYGAALDVFRRSLVSPSIPPLSEHVRRGEWQAYRALCLRRLGMTALACLLVYAGTGVGGRHLLGSLIGHGGLTSGNMQLLWTLLMLMGGYLLGGALNHVLAQALYVQGDAATPAKIGVIAFTVGASLKLAGVVAWGVQGIALASGAQYLFGLVLFWVAWRRSLARTAGRKTFPAEAMR